ncbi:23S ribosomal RNA methyltransferase Erm [Candidatus Beckwithbacteria bacterium]|nr:23S ribosomal RNA methyltransferase Erm [Candidatus Beckwithbacteria bacterium]
MNKNLKSKLYSQNFLTDKKLVKKLIADFGLTNKDLVYEIGCGNGIITQALALECAKVKTIEIDKKLLTQTKSRLQHFKNLEFIYGDFLRLPLPYSEYVIFVNIPFRISADILRKILEVKNSPAKAFLIIQKETAQRWLGKPKINQVSVLYYPWFSFKIRHYLKKFHFRPMPKVEVVSLVIKKRKIPLVKNFNRELYFDFVSFAFNSFAPTLAQGLRHIFTKSEYRYISQNLKFAYQALPTQLTQMQWLAAFCLFSRFNY